MTSMPVYQISYLRQREELRDEACVTAWLEALAAHGYYLTEGEEQERFLQRYAEVLQTQSLSPGCSALAREAAHDFCIGNPEELACIAYALLEDFDVSVGLFEPEGSVMVCTDDSHFTGGELYRQNYQWFLTLVETTYRQWHPLYGFAHAGGYETPPSRDDVLALEVRRLFSINLFGPEYVAQLGRKAVLSTPAWQVRELDDGGVMVVPVPYIEDDWRQGSPYDLNLVAEHLGLSP